MVNAGNYSIHGAYEMLNSDSYFLGDVVHEEFIIEKLDAGWPESEEEQVGNVKLEEEVTRRSKD